MHFAWTVGVGVESWCYLTPMLAATTSSGFNLCMDMVQLNAIPRPATATQLQDVSITP
jgi:hypothetical protein